MKKCTKCGVEKTLDSFGKRKASVDGLEHKCKACKKISSKAYRESHKEEISAKDKAYYEANKEKVKANCKAWREANKEKISAKNKAHYEANKEEEAVRSKAYYEANKEKVKANCKAYYEANKEEILSREKVYREKNKERLAATAKAYYEANKEEILSKNKIYMKTYNLANPEKGRESKRRRRARRNAVNENYTKEDEAFTKNLFDHACFNCGSTENLAVDHYRPLSKGNALTLTNAIILCRSCNSSKGIKDPEQFFSEEQTMIIQEVFDRVEEIYEEN